MVGGINNCDLTGVMCRPGSLIVIGSGGGGGWCLDWKYLSATATEASPGVK